MHSWGKFDQYIFGHSWGKVEAEVGGHSFSWGKRHSWDTFPLQHTSNKTNSNWWIMLSLCPNYASTMPWLCSNYALCKLCLNCASCPNYAPTIKCLNHKSLCFATTMPRAAMFRQTSDLHALLFHCPALVIHIWIKLWTILPKQWIVCRQCIKSYILLLT